MASNQTIIIRAVAKNLKGATYKQVSEDTGLGYWEITSAVQQLKNRRLVKTIRNKNNNAEIILDKTPNSITRTKRLCPDWQDFWEDEWRENVFKNQNL